MNRWVRICLMAGVTAALISSYFLWSRVLPSSVDQVDGTTSGEITATMAADVVVLGGTPEGVSAAVSSARMGKKVILISAHDKVGGLLTRSGLQMIDFSMRPDRKGMLNGGIMKEFVDQVHGLYDVDLLERILRNMVQREPNITLLLNTAIGRPKVRGHVVESVTVREGDKVTRVVGKRFIDATEDADVAAAAGVAFTYGREDYRGDRAAQAVTQIFRLTGYNWDRATRAIPLKGDEKSAGYTNETIWAYDTLMRAYKPFHPRAKVRALNIGRQSDGSVIINGLWIFGVDPLDPASRRAGVAIANEEIAHLVEYMRLNIPGCEELAFGGVAEDLYVRESRHMSDALYQLTIDDVLDNRDQPDAIGYGSYPVDIQASKSSEDWKIVGVPSQYAIPLRSLVPRSLDNLLVASRSTGYTSLAHGSARTAPIGIAAGQGAGVAAALSIDHNISLPALAREQRLVTALQSLLRAQGVVLEPFGLASPLDGNPYADDARYFRRRGLVWGGYSNQYGLDEALTGQRLTEFLRGAAQVYGKPMPSALPSTGSISVGSALDALYAVAGTKPADPLGDAMVAEAVDHSATASQMMTQGAFYRAARILAFPEKNLH